MKKLPIFILMMLIPAISFAGTGTEMLKFGTGIVTAYALHEVGHATAGYLTGTDLDWKIGKHNQSIVFDERADNHTDGALLHASGLSTQLLISEIILQTDEIYKNDSFIRGVMFWNIINPIFYSIDYWFLNRMNFENRSEYRGDIKGFENYTGDTEADIFAAGMLTVAACQGYRYIKTQSWAPDWIKRDDVRLNFNSAGDVISFVIEIDF